MTLPPFKFLFLPPNFSFVKMSSKNISDSPHVWKGKHILPIMSCFSTRFFFFLWKKLCEAEWKLWLKTCFGGARQPRVVKMIITKTNKKCFYSCQTFFSLCFIHEKKRFSPEENKRIFTWFNMRKNICERFSLSLFHTWIKCFSWERHYFHKWKKK